MSSTQIKREEKQRLEYLAKRVELICPQCQDKFYVLKRDYEYKLKVCDGLYCSRSCRLLAVNLKKRNQGMIESGYEKAYSHSRSGLPH